MYDGYGTIYGYYDTFMNGNVDYGRRADFIDSIFRKYRVPEIVLDAGCGTGSFMSKLREKGYDVIGVDISTDMLSIASENNPGSLLLCQDLRELDLYGTVQGAVCMQDTLNHLDDIADVESAVQRISLFLEPGSLFFFDLNTEYKIKQVINDNTFVYENDDCMLVWQNSTDSELSVDMTLDLFEKDSKGMYTRSTGFIREIFVNDDSVNNIVKSSGLEILERYDGDTLDKIKDNTQRILYVTRKS